MRLGGPVFPWCSEDWESGLLVWSSGTAEELLGTLVWTSA